MTWAVVDIDGVLADVRHRLHFVERSPKDWDGFFAAASHDAALPQGLALVHELVSRELDVVYVSGRPERCREDTLRWLQSHGLPLTSLHLRRDTDRRPARVTKLEVIHSLARKSPVEVVVDDDDAVVRTLRDAGFEVLHATWMSGGTSGVDSSPASAVQETLFEAQEIDGQT